MMNDYNDIQSVAGIANSIDEVTYFIERMLKNGFKNIRSKK